MTRTPTTLPVGQAAARQSRADRRQTSTGRRDGADIVATIALEPVAPLNSQARQRGPRAARRLARVGAPFSRKAVSILPVAITRMPTPTPSAEQSVGLNRVTSVTSLNTPTEPKNEPIRVPIRNTQLYPSTRACSCRANWL